MATFSWAVKRFRVFLGMGKPPLEVVAYSSRRFVPFQLRQNSRSKTGRREGALGFATLTTAMPDQELPKGYIFSLTIFPPCENLTCVADTLLDSFGLAVIAVLRHVIKAEIGGAIVLHQALFDFDRQPIRQWFVKELEELGRQSSSKIPASGTGRPSHHIQEEVEGTEPFAIGFVPANRSLSSGSDCNVSVVAPDLTAHS